MIILLECCHNFWSGGTEGTKFADRAPLTFNCSRPSCSSVYYIRNDRLVISRRPHFDSNTISVKVYKKRLFLELERNGADVLDDTRSYKKYFFVLTPPHSRIDKDNAVALREPFGISTKSTIYFNSNPNTRQH